VSLGGNNALPDPVVTLYDSNATIITTNDNWKDSQWSAIENIGLQPPNDLAAAILVTLAAGNYTAIVTDKNGSKLKVQGERLATINPARRKTIAAENKQ
jgi:hypothetical protein